MIEVVLADKYYLGDLLEDGGATLTDSLAEIAYRGSVVLPATPDMPTTEPGQAIRVSGPHPETGNMVVLLDGVLWTVESRDRGQKMLAFTICDRTIYLDRSEDECVFPSGQTAAARLKKYAADWGLSLGKLADTGAALGQVVYRSQSIFEMITRDLSETARQGGGLFRARMIGTQLELVKLGSNETVWKLETIEEVNQTRTLDGAVTKVTVLGAAAEGEKSDVSDVQVGDTKLGILQRIVRDDQVDNPGAATAAAKALLGGVQETVSVTGPDVATIRAGDKVALDGVNWLVATVQHSLGNPGRMNLDLGSEEYIRRRFYARRDN